MKKIYILISNLIVFIAITSCVGTVKTEDPQNTMSVVNTTSAIDDFAGIEKAIAISNKKVELFFKPAIKDIDKYSYVITYDRQQIPIYVAANSLVTNYNGEVKYTVSGLETNTTYVFSVQIRDMTSGRESAVTKSLSAKTFANITANFNGISELRNLSGSAGLNAIEVFWPEAEVLGGANGSAENFPGDPYQYVITVIDSNYINPSEMNNTSVPDTMRKVVVVDSDKRSTVVYGLNADTKYYVQVRCIQKGFSLPQNSADINYKNEENTSYLEIKTYSQDASFPFQADKVELSYPPGNAGLTSLKVKWIKPEGNFDHYRIFYVRRYSPTDNSIMNLTNFLNSTTVDPLCYDAESTSTNADNLVYCQQASVSESSTIISGLDPLTQYDVILYVCVDSACTIKQKSSLVSLITDPDVTLFSGVKEIAASTDVNNLNTLKLVFRPPTYQSGTISGFIVDYYSDVNGTAVPLNGDEASNPPFTIDPFEIAKDCPSTLTESDTCFLTVRGVDLTSSNKYCFAVYPFKYDPQGNVVKSSKWQTFKPVCPGKPLINVPTASEFSGFTRSECSKVTPSSGPEFGMVTLYWDAPSESSIGLYQSYEVFYLDSIFGFFDFTTAQNEFDYGTGVFYNRISVNRNATSLTISNLDPTHKYYFGINTFFNTPSQYLRSLPNNGKESCDFPNL